MITDALNVSMLRIAYDLAKGSHDPSTQCGAVLGPYDPQYVDVYSWGINQFPQGVKETPERWERPLKYSIIEHAERNAIYDAARQGVCTESLTMWAPWAACADCARAIIQARICRLVRHKQASDRSPAFWLDSIQVADDMLHEAGVEIVDFDGKICPDTSSWKLLHTGEIWNP